MVGDVLWSVVRPFGVGPHPFAVRDAGLDTALEEGRGAPFHEFVQAIDEAVFERPLFFPEDATSVLWTHVLPWLSRDQECRYANFLEWRSPSSDSDSPALTVDERQFLLRALLGVMSEEERREQAVHAQLVAEKKRISERVPLLEHQAETDLRRVRDVLHLDGEVRIGRLFWSLAEGELARRRSALDEREREIHESDIRQQHREILEQAIRTETQAKRAFDEMERAYSYEKAQLEAADGQSALDQLVQLPPPPDYCNVPMKVARHQGCPLAVGRPIHLQEHRAKRATESELAERRANLERLEEVVKQAKAAYESAKRDTDRARGELQDAEDKFMEARVAVARERATLAEFERLIRNAEQAEAEAARLRNRLQELEADIRQSQGRQEEFRVASRVALGHLSRAFDRVVQALLGRSVRGAVKLSGRSLTLAIEAHGDRDSAAIATVKLLAFDLAALICGIEGHGSVPRFLMHDGPREADLSPDVYERLFLLAGELEHAGGGEPVFQYILTTTTPPPKAFQGLPFLRLQLAGTPARSRLMGQDL